MYLVVLSRMRLGSDLNINHPPPAALNRPAAENGSPVFHFNDAELASTLR